MRDQRRHPRGFTIIETLLAGMVLAMFGAALAAGVAQAAGQLQRDRDYRRAARLLDEVLTRASIVGPAVLQVQGPVAGSFDDDFAWSLEIEQRPLSALYDLTATVSWSRGAAGRAASASTVLYDPASAAPTSLSWEMLDQ